MDQFLDRPGVERTVEPVEARIEVVADGAGFRAELWLRTGGREQRRNLADERCDVLAAAVAFIVAVAVDPDLIGDPVAVAEPAPPPPVPPTEPLAPAVPGLGPPERPPPPRWPVRGAVRLSGGGMVGVLPGFAPGVGLAGLLLVGRARAEVGGTWQFDRDVELEGGTSARLRLWTLEARGCFAPAVRILEFPVCGGLSAGAMRGESRGVTQPAVDRVAWLAIRAGAGLSVVPSPYAAVSLAADAVIPLSKPSFRIEGVGTVHEAADVGLFAQLSVEARFP